MQNDLSKVGKTESRLNTVVWASSKYKAVEGRLEMKANLKRVI